LAAALLCLLAAPDARAADMAARVELGRRLFYDADLSIDGTMSCATCHEQKRGFTDDNPTRPGVHGDPGRRNVMALANVAWAPVLTWGDPRLDTLEKQALVPIAGTDPVEMGMAGHEAAIAERLGAGGCYRAMFARAFPAEDGAITLATVTRALAAFQRTLISFGSPYDSHRMTEPARRGEALFGARCAGCHSGINFTDYRYHAVAPLAPGAEDRGLGEVTGRRADDGKFRTPGLRNAALTAPYLHDGSAASLPEAIRRHGEPGRLTPSEMTEIVAFLDTLTDRRFVTDARFSLPRTACGKPL
jgi:cytochrome c peroxidase